MAKQVLAYSWGRETIEEAEDTVHLPLRRWCSDADAESLQLTANLQPCLVAVEVAMFRVIERELEPKFELFAGHSLGEYAALVASQRLGFAAAMRLVAIRGAAMQRAVALGQGTMAAVIGVGHERVSAACQRAGAETYQVVEVANLNSPDQTIISGHVGAVGAAGEMCASQGARVVPLAVSAPFHCSLMQPAAQELAPYVAATEVLGGNGRILVNCTGNEAAEYHAAWLVEQVCAPVHWVASMARAAALGTSLAVEIGPGRVLCGLGRRNWSDGQVKLVASHDLDALLRSGVEGPRGGR